MIIEDEIFMKNSKHNYDNLPKEVMERVNLGVVGVSLSMYDEGMTIEELAEVTGIDTLNVKKSLDFLIQSRMVKYTSYSNLYKVTNFKKLLALLINLGLVFPMSDLQKMPRGEDKKSSN